MRAKTLGCTSMLLIWLTTVVCYVGYSVPDLGAHMDKGDRVNRFEEEPGELADGNGIGILSVKNSVIRLFIKPDKDLLELIRETVPFLVVQIPSDQNVESCFGGSVPESLRKEFEKAGISLSRKAISRQKSANWQIVDFQERRFRREKQRIYIAETDEGAIKIYRTIRETGSDAGVMKIIRSIRVEGSLESESTSFTVSRCIDSPKYYEVQNNPLKLVSVGLLFEDGFIKDILVDGRLRIGGENASFHNSRWLIVRSSSDIAELGNSSEMLGPCRKGSMDYYVRLGDVINCRCILSSGSYIPENALITLYPSSVALLSDEDRAIIQGRSLLDSFDIRIYPDIRRFEGSGEEDEKAKYKANAIIGAKYNGMLPSKMLGPVMSANRASPFITYPTPKFWGDKTHLQSEFSHTEPVTSVYADAEFKDDLHDGEIPDDLRVKFEEKDLPLPDGAHIEKRDNNTWIVFDGKTPNYEFEMHEIKKDELELIIFPDPIPTITTIDLLEHSNIHFGIDFNFLSIPLFLLLPEVKVDVVTGFYQAEMKLRQDLEENDIWSWHITPSLVFRVIDEKRVTFSMSGGIMYLKLLDDSVGLRDDNHLAFRSRIDLNIHPRLSRRDRSVFLSGGYSSELRNSSNNIISLQIGYSTPIPRIHF